MRVDTSCTMRTLGPSHMEKSDKILVVDEDMVVAGNCVGAEFLAEAMEAVVG
jgi:hypothetical protein